MHNVSPTVLLCISVFSLVLSFLALPSLITQRHPPAVDCFPPYQYLQPCVTILHCMVDCALNVLIGLNRTHWNQTGDGFLLAISLLYVLSMACAIFSQLFHILRILPKGRVLGERSFPWWWHEYGIILITLTTLIKTLPHVSLHQGTLQFWTLFGASLLEFAAFVYTYGYLLCTLRTGSPKKRWRLGLLTLLHFLVALTVIVCSFLGWQVSSLQCLLQPILLVPIALLSLLRSFHSALAATDWMRLQREKSSSNIRSRPNTAPDSSSQSALTQHCQRGSAAKIPLSFDASSRNPSTAPSIPYGTPELDGLNGAKRKEAIGDQAFNVQTSLSLGRSSLDPYRAQHDLPEVREPIERKVHQGKHQSLTNESETEPESEMAGKHQSSNTLVIDTELHEDDIESARVQIRRTWAILKGERDIKLGRMKLEGRRVENEPECACTDWMNFRNCPSRRCLYRSRNATTEESIIQ